MNVQGSEHVKAEINKSEDFRSRVAQLKDFLSKNSICEDISISLLAAWLSPVPPIFIEVPIKIMSGAGSSGSSMLKKQKQSISDDCISTIADIIGLEGLPLSSHKSTMAKNHIFW